MSEKVIETIEDLAAVSGTFSAELGLKQVGSPSSTQPNKMKSPKGRSSKARTEPGQTTQPGGKKQANKLVYEPKFFVETSPENWRENLQNVLDQIAEKYNVRKFDILNIETANISYGDHFEDRDWLWNETFFSKYLLKAETAKIEQLWWQDQCINQVSIMVWNLVWKTVRETWKETGTYPGADKLSRKIRRSDEGVAESIANTESELFEGNFK